MSDEESMSVPRGTGRGRYGRRPAPDRRFTASERAAALARIDECVPIKVVAADIGAAYTTVHAWLRQRRVGSE